MAMDDDGHDGDGVEADADKALVVPMIDGKLVTNKVVVAVVDKQNRTRKRIRSRQQPLR